MTESPSATPFDFHGRRVVLAGGSRGIGQSIALAFAAAGATVSICARGAESAALFLASPWAEWITGQTLCVDGAQGLSG